MGSTGLVKLTLKLPSLSAVVSTVLPSGSVITTLAPASVVPLMVLPSLATFKVVTSGAVASKRALSAASLLPAALVMVAVTFKLAPSAGSATPVTVWVEPAVTPF